MSCRSCVVSSTVVPRSSFNCRRNPRTFALLTTSSPIVGSSRYSTSGSCSSAAAMSPRIRCPSDSWRTGTSSSSPRSRRSTHRSRFSSNRALGTRYIRRISPYESFSGRSHHSVVRCPKTTPIRCARRTRSRAGSMPATLSRPPLGVRIPVSILIVVDFPAPLGPM